MMSNSLLIVQVIYLNEDAMTCYLHNKTLPTDNVFIEDMKLSTCASLEDIVGQLQVKLAQHERYRSALRHQKQRSGHIDEVYAVFHDGAVTRLLQGDSISAGSELRLWPTESTVLARQLDSSELSVMPPDALEVLFKNVRTGKDMASLRSVSATIASQHVSHSIKHMIVVVRWTLCI